MRARCRGGNLLRTAHAGLVQQEMSPAAVLIAATDAPDGGPVALQVGGHGLDGLTAGDGQDDTSVLDLEPGQPAAARDRLQDREIRFSDGHRARFPATHGTTSDAEAGAIPSIAVSPNLLHDFVPEPLAGVWKYMMTNEVWARVEALKAKYPAPAE